MLEKINFVYFIISFCIGIAYVYCVTPKPEIVYKFPSPTNLEKIIYKDNSNSCYKYNVENINCDDVENKDTIKSQPVMESFKNNK
tara:strand:- start:204 stop:458 length:255 start_codon:yes stop_codon:yes gene_type:complete